MSARLELTRGGIDHERVAACMIALCIIETTATRDIAGRATQLHDRIASDGLGPWDRLWCSIDRIEIDEGFHEVTVGPLSFRDDEALLRAVVDTLRRDAGELGWVEASATEDALCLAQVVEDALAFRAQLREGGDEPW